jgi:hypothetical protein
MPSCAQFPTSTLGLDSCPTLPLIHLASSTSGRLPSPISRSDSGLTCGSAA